MWPASCPCTEAVIERQGRHMARLLDELLDISRVTHGKIELRKRPIDLCSLVRDTVAANETVIRGREHHVVTDLADEPLWVAADPIRLEQVLTNLLHNAVKYMEPGGTIHVSTLAEDDLRAATRARHRRRHLRRRPAAHLRSVRAGRPLARSGPRRVGHRLDAACATWSKCMAAPSPPRATAKDWAANSPCGCRCSSQPAAVRRRRSRPYRAKRQRRIVIVEDNADAREMLQMLLAVEGHEVDIAEDGRDGLALIERLQPDVALIDIGLPLLNGYDVARTSACAQPGSARVAGGADRLWAAGRSAAGAGGRLRRALDQAGQSRSADANHVPRAPGCDRFAGLAHDLAQLPRLHSAAAPAIWDRILPPVIASC